MEVTLSLVDTCSQYIEVKLKLEISELNPVFSFAMWRPGRYEWGNFMRNIQELRIETSSGKLLPVFFSGESFIFSLTQSDEITITYKVYCAELNAGSSWVSEDFYYFNFINFIPCCLGKENEKINLTLDLPSHFVAKTTLKPDGRAKFLASSYHELVDSPLLTAKDLVDWIYTVGNTNFHICIKGDFLFEKDKVVSDFKSFTESQLHLFGNLPISDYYFYIIMLPYRYYHGVEHQNSTVIVLGPGENYDDLYNELLGISSHELFHAWNVKRIQPKQFVPYNYFSPVYHKEGFVTEGFTTYYGDYMLLCSRVFSFEEFATELNTTLHRVFWNEGRAVSSLVDSSLMLWSNGYKPTATENKVSIYAEGSLVAWMLDIELRKVSFNKISLDSLMQKLWADVNPTYVGYSLERIISYCENLTGVSFESFFERYVFGTQIRLVDLKDSLSYLGLSVNEVPNQNPRIQFVGLVLNAKNEVEKVAPTSPAFSVLMKGDLIIEEEIQDNSRYVCQVLRMGKKLVVSFDFDPMNSFYPQLFLEKNKEATDYQVQNFNSWLGEISKKES